MTNRRGESIGQGSQDLISRGGAHMDTAADLRGWLLWVIKIRFVIITLIFATEFTVQQLVPHPSHLVSIEALGLIVIFWYVLGLFYLMYYQIGRDYLLQAHLQIYVDVLVITAVVHSTGDLESDYLSLYVVVIILASVLLSRARAYLAAGASFIGLASLLGVDAYGVYFPALVQRHSFLAYLVRPSTAAENLRLLGAKAFAALLAFLAVAYLASYLAERLRTTGDELRRRAGQVASLHAINEGIIRSMLGGLMRTDLEGLVHDLNPAGAAILGREPAEVKGLLVDQVLPGVRSEGSRTDDAWARHEILYRHPNGSRRILGISSSPLKMAEGIFGTIYTFQDLTEEKRRDAEYRTQERMAALGRISAAIAHEIRNPLASIAGSVRMLEGIASFDDDESKLIRIVSRESSRLEKLVSDFLTYSREQRLKFRPLNLVGLVDETLMLLENHPARSPACRIERCFPAGPVVAEVDEEKIRQVLWNICNNSLRAMPEGGTLRATVESSNGAGVRVVLEDSGVGLSSEQMERLFEPFQAWFSRGTGLGLAISRQIVQGHHGQIRVESEVGKGARFIVELPRQQEAGVLADAA
jgi:two-component system, NtrC family, sensor histidine kinase PilS